MGPAPLSRYVARHLGAALRVLLVSRVFWPNIGGIEKHVQWLAEALIRRGHQCDVLTMNRSWADGSSYPPFDRLGEIGVYRVPFVGSTRYPIAPRVARFAARYDVVHVHAVDFLADWLVTTRRWHGRPVVLSSHGGFFHTAFLKHAKKLWFHTATRLLVHSVDALITTSEQDSALFRKLTSRLHPVRQAVDTRAFAALPSAPVPGRWVTVGRVDVHKGIAALIKVLARVKNEDGRDFLLTVVGPEVVDGLIPSLEAERDRLGLGAQVTFTRKVPFEALLEQVRTAELGIFPSEYESFGISVVEVMAAGVVPVLNDIHAFRCFTHERKSGFVVPFSDVEAAAATLRRARDLGDARAKMVAAAREVAATYDWDVVVAEIEAIYQEVIRRRRAG